MKRKVILIFFASLLFYAFYDMYRASVPSTIEDFFLPGSQPGDSGSLEDPSKCNNCHGDYHSAVEPDFNWKGTMMAQAARDPLYHAALAIANQDAPESGDLCIRCHSPKGWLEGRSEPTDGSALSAKDREGITCDFCHKLVKPTPLGVNPYPNDPIYTSNTYPLDQAYLATLQEIPSISGNGMYIADRSSAKRGPFDDANPNHQFIYSPFHSSSELCGTCHDVSNPAFSSIKDGNGNILDYEVNSWNEAAPSFDISSLLHIERTYSEWSKSDYNSPTGVQSNVFGGNKDFVSTCQDCHMRDTTGYGCDKNPPLRQDLPIHDLTGANTFIPKTLNYLYPGEVDTVALNKGVDRARYMLRNASTMELTVVNQSASVKIYNETGHKLPSGYPEGRRMWINLRAWGQMEKYMSLGSMLMLPLILSRTPILRFMK